MRVAAAALADDLDVFRLGSLLALRDVELDLLPFLQAAVAAPGDRAEVHEHIWAVPDLDEAVTLVAVEPLHRALRHLDLLLVLDAAPAAGTGPILPRLPWPASHATRKRGKPSLAYPCLGGGPTMPGPEPARRHITTLGQPG